MKITGIVLLCIGVASLVGRALGSAGLDIWAFVLPAVGLGLLIAGIKKEKKG